MFFYPYQYTSLTKNGFIREHRWYRVYQIFLGFVAAISCFYLGRISHQYTPATPEPHLRTLERTFKYERLFGSHPSPKSDHAWLQLFPSHAGFFQHPTIAPKRSAYSTFHQLHCLDGIRHGYWAMYDAATSGNTINETEVPMMASPPHIRHCIDLLRQTLMCRPDLTIEEKDEELGGVRGFGTVHQCSDWGQLVSWTRKWQDFGEDGGRNFEHDNKHKEHHHHD